MTGLPYWLDESRETGTGLRHWPGESSLRPAGRGRDRGPEVEVVGAGITGCSCALTLARAGAAVRVHDERAIAGGASGRNGGFALRGGAAPYPVTAASVGRERARELWALTERALDALELVGGEAFRRTGSLRLANDADECVELRVEYEALREDGFAAEWREDLPPPLSGRFAAAVFHPPDAALQPARLVRRLARLAVEAGAEFQTGRRVGSLAELEAPTIVIATDGYPSGLLGDLEGLIVPTRGQMIATEPLPTRLFACPHYGRHGFDYWQQTADLRLLAGGFRDFALESEFTSSEETTPIVQGALEAFVAELIGSAPVVTHRWAGIFGLVLDFLPVVGRLPGDGRAWVCGGYSGHGNVLGFACGDLVARAILGERSDLLDLFEPARLLGGVEA